MKGLKKRIEKLEEEISPKGVIKLNITSHVPGLPSQTIVIPVKRKRR